MDEQTIRANLLISGMVMVTDPDGDTWTVLLSRPGEPHSRWDRMTTNKRSVLMGFNRLRRVVTRDDRWDIEVAPGDAFLDRRGAQVRDTAESRSGAIETAVQVAQQVQMGTT